MKYWKINLANPKSNGVDIKKYTSMNKDIESVIELINDEIDWDTMYSIDDCYQRFKDGCFCFVLYQNSKPIGIQWIYDVKPNVYCFNIFISKNKKSENGISQLFFDTICYTKKDESLMGYCDDWNERCGTGTKTKGFQPISVHMFNDMIGAGKKKTTFNLDN